MARDRVENGQLDGQDSEQNSFGLAVDHIGLITIGLFAAILYAVFEIVSESHGFTLYLNTVTILGISVFAQVLINKSKDAEAKLSRINRTLEDKVAQRTAELKESFDQLLAENTVRRQTEKKLRESENHYRTIFENTGTATVIIDADGTISLANNEFVRLTGYTMTEIENRLCWQYFIPEENEEDLRRFHFSRVHDPKNAPKTVETVILDREGNSINILITSAVIPGTDRALASFSDISELKRAQEKIRYQAFYDPLTDLPNKALFLDHLKMAILRHKTREEYRYAVIAMNIDRFKITIDSLGHTIESRLLNDFADILKDCTSQVDTIARLGQDEFVILLDDVEDHNSPIWVVNEIQHRLRKPFNLNNEEVFISASFGIVTKCDSYYLAEHVLRDADMAMINAKNNGKGQFALFDLKMHEEAVQLLQIENDLRRALDKNEIKVHYQPIVACDTRRLVGFEALVRWDHPEHGLVYPETFIPVAEDSGVIVDIGKLVMYEACVQLRKWNEMAHGSENVFMSVNLSAKQFNQPDLEDMTKLILRESGLMPNLLKLEITESVVMADPEEVILLLARLKRLGIRIGIDDFGTGYSSLSYLQRFPVDTLKVDRSFVSRMDPAHPENQKIVEIIISLAHSLGLNVIAEGVETSEQQLILSILKCQYAQGFLFAEPMDRNSVESIASRPGPYYC